MKIIPPEILLEAYSQGIFPMAESKDEENVNWYSATKRGIIPMDAFHVSANVRRIIRQQKFTVKINTRFRDIVEACADRESTWINDLILNSYEELHRFGNAHSVEIFKGKILVGGLYGVHLGAVFFGESMFRREPEADKIALYYCHQILKKNGFELWDTQFYTEHLGRFGCIEIDADEYNILLRKALRKNCSFR